jgi:hemophore-related protein
VGLEHGFARPHSRGEEGRWKASLTRLGVAVGGLSLSLTAGAGIASSDPDLGPIVNSTCSYSQLAAAVNAQGPTVAAGFNANPGLQSGLRRFLAAPTDQRMQMAQEVQRDPGIQPYLGIVQQAFNTCNNY